MKRKVSLSGCDARIGMPQHICCGGAAEIVTKKELFATRGSTRENSASTWKLRPGSMVPAPNTTGKASADRFLGKPGADRVDT